MAKTLFLVLFILFLAMVTYLKNTNNTKIINIEDNNMKIESVFKFGEEIPSVYTCDGDDISPELVISQVPEEAKSLVLIVDDPDAPVGLFVHWVLYNIPPETTVISSQNIPKDAVEGMTNFGSMGYGGPCPPNGQHRYFFKLYALDKMLELPQGATKDQVENAMKENIMQEATLMGVYDRIKK